MSTKVEQARIYFESGFNCAQAVFAAFAQEMGMDESAALRLSSSMGGGMGGLREVCGAVSGMFLAVGGLMGYDAPDDPATKLEHYTRLQVLAERFHAEYGTIICRELLAQHQIDPSPIPADRNEAYYQKRPCARYVEACAALVEELLQKGPDTH